MGGRGWDNYINYEVNLSNVLILIILLSFIISLVFGTLKSFNSLEIDKCIFRQSGYAMQKDTLLVSKIRWGAGGGFRVLLNNIQI